ncbi:MAG: Flp family type IVb pilin [Planctomycetota bacterium]
MEAVKRFVNDERGTETVEWAIMIGLIAVASITFIYGIGVWVQGKFSQLHGGLSAAGTPVP